MVSTLAISPVLGVELDGVDDLSDEVVIARCLEALHWRGVLLLRGMNLDDDAQLAFSRRLGAVLAPGGNEIFKVTLDPTQNPAAEYLKGTFHWHIDDTTNDVPAKATVLTARHVAMVGGGTQFADTYAAYEYLPEERKRQLRGRRVVHSFEAAQRLVKPNPTDDELALWRQLPSHEIPLVWERRDRRRSLAIGATADHVVGMDPAASRALLDELVEWATQERFCYSHEWQVGDVVVWDNTGILHRALPYDAGSARTMHRTTIEGEEPWT